MPRTFAPVQPAIAPAGDAVAGATMTFTERVPAGDGSGPPATHWSNETGGSSSTGAVSTDTSGRIARWFPPNVDGYTVVVSPPGVNPLGLVGYTEHFDVPLSALNKQDAVGSLGFSTRVSGDVHPRLSVEAGGVIRVGDGTAAGDITLSRNAGAGLGGPGWQVFGPIRMWGNGTSTNLNLKIDLAGDMNADYGPGPGGGPLTPTKIWMNTVYTGGTNGNRPHADDVAWDEVTGTTGSYGALIGSSFQHKGKGTVNMLSMNATILGAAGGGTDAYGEMYGFNFLATASRVGALVGVESQIKPTVQGRYNGYSGIITDNTVGYAGWNNNVLGSASMWKNSGSLGLWAFSAGSLLGGTGVHVSSGSTGWKRAYVLNTGAGVDAFCVDGQTGYVGLGGVTTNQTSTIPARLTFATGTTQAEGIQFGITSGQAWLYRTGVDAAGVGILGVTGKLQVNSSNNGAMIVAKSLAATDYAMLAIAHASQSSSVLAVYDSAVTTEFFAIRATGNMAIADARNIILGTTTGTKIGTATGQKIGFFNATPVIQRTLAAAATDAATTQTLANSLRQALIDLGLGA